MQKCERSTRTLGESLETEKTSSTTKSSPECRVRLSSAGARLPSAALVGGARRWTPAVQAAAAAGPSTPVRVARTPHVSR